MLLAAAIEGAGITSTADWLAGAALRAGTLTEVTPTEVTPTEVLPGWGGRENGGVYAILPPGRLVPARTHLFVDAVAQAIRTGCAR